MKKHAKLLLTALMLMLVSAASFAQSSTFGGAADNVTQQFGQFANLAISGLFLAGIVVGGIAAFKFKAHSDAPQQTKITVPIIYTVVAALLIGLPAFLMMAKNSTLGQGSQAGSINGNVYNNIQ